MNQRQLCAALRRHLESYPEAADSLEGIRQWWLPDSLRVAPLESLQEAVEVLVASGEMRRRPLPDGTTLYTGTSGE
jgi:hypothetical protein